MSQLTLKHEPISQELVICPEKTVTVFYGFNGGNHLE